MPYYKTNKNIFSSKIDDVYILFNVSISKYARFNKTSLDLWKILNKKTSLNKLVKVYSKKYPKESIQMITKKLRGVLKFMIKNQLITEYRK